MSHRDSEALQCHWTCVGKRPQYKCSDHCWNWWCGQRLVQCPPIRSRPGSRSIGSRLWCRWSSCRWSWRRSCSLGHWLGMMALSLWCPRLLLLLTRRYSPCWECIPRRPRRCRPRSHFLSGSDVVRKLKGVEVSSELQVKSMQVVYANKNLILRYNQVKFGKVFLTN